MSLEMLLLLFPHSNPNHHVSRRINYMRQAQYRLFKRRYTPHIIPEITLDQHRLLSTTPPF